MATRVVDAPPAPQLVQVAEVAPEPTLQQGVIQGCEGYLNRKTRILKRWKKQWIKIVPGKQREFEDQKLVA